MGADLNSRIETKAAATPPPSKVVAARESGKPLDVDQKVELERTLRAKIGQMEPEFQRAMPKGLEAQQLIRDALTAVRAVPRLAECDPQTVLGALMTCAQLGLRVNVMGQAYVLPYWSKRDRIYNAQFVLGYRGIVELGFRSDQIADIGFRAVREKDIFDCDYGTGEITHKPEKREAPGDAYGYYALIRFKGGGRTFYYMSVPEAQAYRDKFASARDKEGNIVGPWRDHFDAMAGKSCLKQGAKTIPQGKELAVALVADETLRVDLSPDADAAEVSTGLDVIDGSVVERETPNPAG